MTEILKALDAITSRVLAGRFRHCRAVPDLAVAAVAIDSGGHRTSEVMAFSAARLNRRVWAIKGRGGPGVPLWPKRPPKAKRASVAPLHVVGVDGAKHVLFGRLRASLARGAGACHWPDDRDHDWFAGLVAERAVRRYVKGVPRLDFVKDPGVRNEPLDCRVYATAALHGLYAAGLRLADSAEAMRVAPMRAEQPSDAAAPVTAAKVTRSNWIGR